MAILQSKANEVFAAAGLSHLPRKRRVSSVPHWGAETLQAVAPTFLSALPQPGGQDPKTSSWLSTHPTLPEQEPIGCAGPNLEFNGLRCFRKAGEKRGVWGWGRKQWVRGSLSLRLLLTLLDPEGQHHLSYLLEKMLPGRPRKPLS